MVTTLPKLRKEVIDIVFPGMEESELLNWVETDPEGFWKEWRRKPGTAASLELITELQTIYPDKFTTEFVREINRLLYKRVPVTEPVTAPPVTPVTELPIAEEGIFPTTATEEGWEFTGIIWDVEGNPLDYMATSPTGEQYTMEELDTLIIQQERLEESIPSVYPNLTMEEFFEYVETDFDSFNEDMQTGGYTEEKAELLSAMGNSPEEIDDFYKVTEPELQPLPPEGIVYTVKDEQGNDIELHMLEDFEYVGMERKLRSKDFIVFHKGQEVGKIIHGTGEFVPYEPTFLEKVGATAIRVLQYALYPFTLSGMGWNRISRLIGGEMPTPKESEEWLRGEWLPGGTEYAKYMELPFWQRLGLEAPAWLSLGVLGITAIKARAALAPLAARPGLPGVLPAIARAALYPIAGYEHAVGLGLKYTIAVPLKITLKGVSSATNAAFNKALSGRFGFWLAMQGSRGEHANKIVAYFLSRNHAWLHRKAQEAMIRRHAQGVAAKQATNMAAQDVANDAIPLLLEAAKSVTGKELVPVVSGSLVPSVFTATQGASPALVSALTGLTDKLITGEITIAQITPEYITSQIATGLEKTVSLVAQLEEMGHTLEAISAMRNEEAWANLFKTPVGEAAIPEVKPPTVPKAVEEVSAVPKAVRTLPLEEVSKLETRMPLNLIRKDESVEIARLTKEIQEEGITEPITIRVREDGSQIVWDGLHRLIVAQDLGIKNIPVQFIGDEGIAIKKPPTIPQPPVEPELRAITEEQTGTLNTLAKEKLIMTEEGKTKPQLRRLMKALTGKSRINQLTQAEADLVIEAVGRLEVKYGRPPVIPTGVGLITAEFAEKIPLLKEVGILEKVRPTRHVFEKMGLRQEVWKPAFEAEVRVYEEHQAFDKELNRIGKLVGKDPGRRQLVFRELENPGSQVGLTFDEKRAVTWFRKYFDSWADRLNLPENKRRKNYVTHIFEEEISRQLKAKHPIDPELIKALDYITPKTVFNPYLQKRLGQTIGLREDPFAAATAYEARALKVFYYEPLIQRIRVYQKYLPPHSAKYLSDFIKRITNRPLTIDRELNQTIKEFGDRVRGLPGGEVLANSLTRGNPGGLVSYNLTSVLYTLWLGFKPTSAIRNIGQHTLELAEVGPIHFADSIRLRTTQEGRAALKESLVLRSRRGAFIPAIDSSFASKWTDSFREKALWMFRFADKQNVSDAFLGGYSEAKALFPDAPRELWINRGDEVAADTQYLYTKFNSFQMSQNSIGRVFSMLTTWTENWLELMTKWISRKPSQVYLAYTKETGQAMPKKNWSQTYKALLLYMLIVGLGYVLKEKTRLKAWEYTGITSLRYLSDIVGGEFPALQAPGAVADLIIGFLTDDERRLKTGWNAMKSTFIPSIIKQMNYVAEGERDWLTLLLYLEGKDIEIKRLKNKWEKGWKEYPLFKDDEGVYDPDLKSEYIKTHPEHAGWSDAKIRDQWREDNPLLEAQMFVVGQFTTLSTDKARAEVLRLIGEHKIDTELIDGYEKVFGIDTEPELQKFQNRLGHLEKFVAGEEAEYFTTSNFATEVNRFVNIMGRSKVERDGNKLAIEYLHATDLWEVYYNLEEDDARTLWRQQFPDVEALLYLFGRVSSFKNPKSAEVLLGLMKKYNIPPQAIRAFIEDPTRYDELFTQKFELEQKWFDQTTEYENFGNTEAPNYIEDTELRKEARAKFKEDNPDWVADMRRIEAIDNDASDVIIERWVERGKTIDEFGAGSSQAKVWLLDNPEVHKWALDNKLLSDDGSDWNENVLRINVELEGLDKESEEYRKLNYRKNAYTNDFSEELIDTYVDYYMMPPKPEDEDYWFEDDWFLMENPAFYQALLDKGIFTKERDFSKVPTREVYAKYLGYRKEKPEKPDDWKDTTNQDLWYEDDWYFMEHPDIYGEVYLGFLGNQPKDFSNVPTREVFMKWLVYSSLKTRYDRDTYRLVNPALDEWGVSAGIWKITMSEKRRRLSISEQEKFYEDIEEALRELEEELAKLR